jgi:predicted nucleic acid-binding protein
MRIWEPQGGSAWMNLFLDNNVLIGYIFETDNWNSKSLDVMASSLDRYSSNTVWQECKDIYKKNTGIIKKEFRHIIREFNRKQSFNLKKASSVLKKYSIGSCLIEYFENNPVDNIKAAKNQLRKLQRDMEKRCLDNYQHINQLVKICSRNNPYNDIYQLLETDGLAEEEFMDLEIILDAHHVGLNIGQMFLVTGDYRDIVSRKELILANTSLEDVIGLGEFDFR